MLSKLKIKVGTDPFWTAATCRRFQSADMSAHSKISSCEYQPSQKHARPTKAANGTTVIANES
jgi:hypothetical protein